MKKFLALALLVLAPVAAFAAWGARDVVPAATLLVPYAVVTTDANNVPDDTGYTTLFAITNVSQNAQIVHLTLWNARSLPVVDWDVFLTGYDVWTINFRDLLNGRFDLFDTNKPATGFWTQSSSKWGVPPIAPNVFGPSSNNTTNLGSLPAPQDYDVAGSRPANCGRTVPPYGDLSGLGPVIRSNIRAGQRSIDYFVYECQGVGALNGLWHANLGGAPLFFYVTADITTRCSVDFPSSGTYWTAGVITNSPLDNVLVGDVTYINQTQNFSEMINAVHIETGTDATVLNFYELDFIDEDVYDIVADIDTREVLGNDFAFRYATGAVSSDLIVWKNVSDVVTDDAGDRFAWSCSVYSYYAWNEDEFTKSRTEGPSGFNVRQPNALPFETQMAPIDLVNWPGLVTSPGNGWGWMRLIFDGGFFYEPWEMEAYVGVRFNFGGYSAALDAAVLGFPTLITTPGE